MDLEDNLYHLYLYTYSCARQKPEADYFINPQNTSEEMAAIAFGVRDAKLTELIQTKCDLLESIRSLFRINLSVTADELAAGKVNRIQAIKMYRARTNCGLKEAKDAIDAAIPYVSPTTAPATSATYINANLPSLDQDEIDLINSGNKIQAIKHYRQRLMDTLGIDCGLKDAKNKVDDFALNKFSSIKDDIIPTDEEVALYKTSKILAIKNIRERLHIGLIEARDALDGAINEGR